MLTSLTVQAQRQVAVWSPANVHLFLFLCFDFSIFLIHKSAQNREDCSLQPISVLRHWYALQTAWLFESLLMKHVGKNTF